VDADHPIIDFDGIDKRAQEGLARWQNGRSPVVIFWHNSKPKRSILALSIRAAGDWPLSGRVRFVPGRDRP
jgi:hypothetical protein